MRDGVVLCDALLELGGTQAIEGVAAYMQRKLGAVHAALLRAQQQEKPQTQLLQPGTASPAGALLRRACRKLARSLHFILKSVWEQTRWSF